MASKITSLHQAQLEAISGAKACLAALKKMERNMESAPFNDWQGYFNDRQSQARGVLAAAGEVSPFASGFILALAEFFHDTIEAGVPDIDNWRPEAAMAPEEVIDSRQELVSLGTD